MAFVIDDLIYALVMMVISFAISYAMQPRPERNDAVVGSMDVPTAEAGKTIPVVFGTMLIKDSQPPSGGCVLKQCLIDWA